MSSTYSSRVSTFILTGILFALDDGKFDEDGWHRIHYAAQDGDVKTVQEDLADGVEVDLRTRNHAKETALHRAAIGGSLAIVKLIVERNSIARRNSNRAKERFTLAIDRIESNGC